MKKLTWKKGIRRINFPLFTPCNFMEEVRRIEKKDLPKHGKIGFEWFEYKDGLSGANIYIEK